MQNRSTLTRSFLRVLPLSFIIKEHFCLLAKAKEYICQSLDTPLQVYAADMNSVTSQWEKFLLVPIVKRLAAHQCLYPITGLLSCLSFSSASTHLRQNLHPSINLVSNLYQVIWGQI